MSYLVVLECLEEGSDTDKSDLVIPHDDVLTLLSIAWDNEGVLEHCEVLLVKLYHGKIVQYYRPYH